LAELAIEAVEHPPRVRGKAIAQQPRDPPQLTERPSEAGLFAGVVDHREHLALQHQIAIRRSAAVLRHRFDRQMAERGENSHAGADAGGACRIRFLIHPRKYCARDTYRGLDPLDIAPQPEQVVRGAGPSPRTQVSLLPPPCCTEVTRLSSEDVTRVSPPGISTYEPPLAET